MNKTIFKKTLSLFLLGLLVFPTACSKKETGPKKIEVEQITKKVDSSTLYVNKVDNLTDDFILGMDSSQVISLEQSGVKYYDFNNNEQDVFKTLAESGINTIRVRVWNDPYDASGHGYGGGNCDIEKCLEIGKRATKYGMGLIVDFHYSDFWADPSKQMCPKAWTDFEPMKDYNLGADKNNSPKAQALYKYTYDSLMLLYNEGVNVKMVSVGNETNTGLAGETTWDNICTLMNMGSKAVRAVYPNALVAVHFTNPETESRYDGLAKKLKYYNVDYDVFASSYYPYWHGTLENLSTVLDDIAKTYNKKVMVMETSYAWTTEDTDFYGNTISNPNGVTHNYPFTIQGQVSSVRDLVDLMVNHTTNGIGVCYWEGTWISVGGDSYDENLLLWQKYGSGWATSYAGSYDEKDAGKNYGGNAVDNQAFFTSKGKPIESLKMFGLLKTGNVVPTYVDGIEDVTVTHYTDEDFTLPSTVNVIMSDNSKNAISVTWDAFNIEEAKLAGNNKYQIHGLAEGKDVYCNLTIMEYNYVQNYSFESNSNWTRTILNGTLDASSYKVQITNENPQTGKYAYHFWASDENTCKFTIEQELSNLKAGTYKLQASLLGGAATSPAKQELQNIYIFVKINGEIKYTKPMYFTNYNDGYKDYILRDIEVADGDTVVIGVYVEANERSSWGDIDDIMFNYQTN